MAARRSVSLTRQLAMLRSVVGPSAYSAITASVMAASGMWLQSRSMAFSGQAPRDLQPVGPLVDVRAHLLRGFDEADVALDGVGAHALRCAPWPGGRGDRAQRDEVAGRRGVASTWISPGDGSGCRRGW
jgi:hypothetical protein